MNRPYRFTILVIALSLTMTMNTIAAPAKMNPRVKKAVEKGKVYLIDSIQADGRFPGTFVDQAGNSALSIYALLKCGIPVDHAVMKKALPGIIRYANTALPNRDNKFTYNAGIVLLALDALREANDNPVRGGASPGSPGEKGAAPKVKINRNKLRAAIHRLARMLVKSQNGDGGYGYKFGSRSDLSNTQYGALGMWAARRSGYKVNKTSLTKLARYVMSIQEKFEAGDRYSEPDAAGFSYGANNKKATQPMTAAGIGTLAIIFSEITKKRIDRKEYESPGDKPVEGEEKEVQLIEDGAAANDKNKKPQDKPGKKMIKRPPNIQEAIDAAFAWLAENGYAHPDSYHLYGLERACTLTNTTKIGGADWYALLSDIAVGMQRPDGSWLNSRNDVNISTAWTLLFLVRATRQMIETDPQYDSPGEKPLKKEARAE